MQTLLLVLRLLPMLLELVKMFQQYRLTQQAIKQIEDDLLMTADYLVTRSKLARAEVKDNPQDVENDPFNRD